MNLIELRWSTGFHGDCYSAHCLQLKLALWSSQLSAETHRINVEATLLIHSPKYRLFTLTSRFMQSTRDYCQNALRLHPEWCNLLVITTTTVITLYLTQLTADFIHYWCLHWRLWFAYFLLWTNALCVSASTGFLACTMVAPVPPYEDLRMCDYAAFQKPKPHRSSTSNGVVSAILNVATACQEPPLWDKQTPIFIPVTLSTAISFDCQMAHHSIILQPFTDFSCRSMHRQLSLVERHETIAL